ncbi:PH domain-containing protein [Paraburkholderia sp. UCT31]|uniref:PH domain-containing protein n=1 Tax=Paraburkholderia sp. UCT31 TaxID=2615209 RepID=UPI0016560120|nr:PH domain-containing protein [Paraburkholderia sp. UCT31]MBC8737320.1 PH domain-containing protein [Paraburkholderia sp. UCT31]
MSFIENTLSDEERVLRHIRLHPLAFVKSYATTFAGAASLIAAILLRSEIAFGVCVGLFALTLYFYLPKKAVEMAVTDWRVIKKSGLLSRDTQEIRLDAIETATFKQSLLGRLFNYGTLHITGRGETSIFLQPVSSPVEAKKALEQAQRAFSAHGSGPFNG